MVDKDEQSSRQTGTRYHNRFTAGGIALWRLGGTGQGMTKEW